MCEQIMTELSVFMFSLRLFIWFRLFLHY